MAMSSSPKTRSDKKHKAAGTLHRSPTTYCREFLQYNSNLDVQKLFWVDVCYFLTPILRARNRPMPKHSKAQKGDLIPAQSDKIGATPKTSTNSRVSTLNKSRKSRPVPAKMQPNYDAITALTDAFCREHLDKHYLVIAQHMTAALCRTNPSPLASGLPRTWACGIIYVIGQINFLTDPSTRPYMPTADLCSLFEFP